MRSIKAKLILAMFLKSMVIILVIGLSAKWIWASRFNEVVAGRAAEGFMADMAEYYLTYGSWEQANSQQSFVDFIGSRGSAPARPGPNQGPRPVYPDASSPPPRPEAGMQPAGPRRGLAPVHVLVDEKGMLLTDSGGRQAGEILDGFQLNRSQPLAINGRTIGYVVQLERPLLTELEAQYVEAQNQAWWFSMILALALAGPAGIFVASYFSRPMHEITLALKAMQKGALRQKVEVRSRDELGQMASSFNEMSENLASAYEELERSRAKLTAQAAILETLSRTDELTRLFNRRAFDEQAKVLQSQSERHDRPLTYAVIDLDNFKQINDGFSHITGDAVLKELSKMIKDSIRVSDVAARYGGDEFVIAFPESDVAGASRIANRLRKRVETFDWNQLADGLKVTVSIGMGAWVHGKSLESVLRSADENLYKAKQEGRNQVFA